MAKGKGWHGDSAGHARAARKRKSRGSRSPLLGSYKKRMQTGKALLAKKRVVDIIRNIDKMNEMKRSRGRLLREPSSYVYKERSKDFWKPLRGK